MRRVDDLIEAIADMDNLRMAFWKAKKGKTLSRAVAQYRKNLGLNLFRLRENILTGRVEVGQYRFFKVFDPKERQICAPAFSEQVLHHALMNVCHVYFEKVQIFDSYASRPGKGVHKALDRAVEFTRPDYWFLKLDVRKFYESVHHETLKVQLRRMFKDHLLLSIFEKIIDSYESKPGRGLPIGNLTSQYFANHYLAGLDHYIKEQLRCQGYVRYMDDMVLWHPDKPWLKETRNAILDFLEGQLKLTFKPELLNLSQRGLPFLGYLVFPFHIRLSQRSKKRYINKMHFLEEQYHSGAWTEAECQRRALPLIAFTLHADSKPFRKKVSLKMKGQSL